ncbi:MAG TPA: ABC transporter permease [Thermomicrobiales bacterium]|nr:ABC transporter permease [Thermomicrobiales bacterium]
MNLDYLRNNQHQIWQLTLEHLQLTVTALALALIVAIPLGILVATVRPLSLPILVVLSLIYTIPSLALLAFLIPVLHLGKRPAIVVLALYAQLALVRNLAAALRLVDPAILEAAAGTGMTRWQIFWKVRLPLGLPILIAGLRIATVTTISLATITAWINAGGLGSLLFDGIARDYPSEILAGTIAITALALCVNFLLRLLEAFTPAVRSRRSVR